MELGTDVVAPATIDPDEAGMWNLKQRQKETEKNYVDKYKDAYTISEEYFETPEMGDFYLGAVDCDYLERLDELMNTEEPDAKNAAYYTEKPASTDCGDIEQGKATMLAVTVNNTPQAVENGWLNGMRLLCKIGSLNTDGNETQEAKNALNDFKKGLMQGVNNYGTLTDDDNFTLCLYGVSLSEPSKWVTETTFPDNLKTKKVTLKDIKDKSMYEIEYGDNGIIAPSGNPAKTLKEVYEQMPEKITTVTLDYKDQKPEERVITKEEVGELLETAEKDPNDGLVEAYILGFNQWKNLQTGSVETAKICGKWRQIIRTDNGFKWLLQSGKNKEHSEVEEISSKMSEILSKVNNKVYIVVDNTIKGYSSLSSFGKQNILDNPKYVAEINEMANGTEHGALNGYSLAMMESSGIRIGSAYIKIDNQWANLEKVLLSQFQTEDKSLIKYNNNFTPGSNAFKQDYGFDQFKFADAFMELTEEIDDRKKIQQKIFGKDFDSLNKWTVTIGDATFFIPPVNITVQSNVQNNSQPLLRARGDAIKNSSRTVRKLFLTMYFCGEDGINGYEYKDKLPNGEETTYYMNGLRALLAQFRFTPFLPIENDYINNTLGIDAVSMQNIVISSEPGLPKMFQVQLSLNEFDYCVYMPELVTNGIIDEEFDGNLFASCINWPTFRFYYQRALQKGSKFAKKGLEFNTTDYLIETLQNGTMLQPMKFNSSSADFYIANEECLEKLLQEKMSADKGLNVQVRFSEEEKEPIKGIANFAQYLADYFNSEDFKKNLNDVNSIDQGYHYVFNQKFFGDNPNSGQTYSEIKVVKNGQTQETYEQAQEKARTKDKGNDQARKKIALMIDGLKEKIASFDDKEVKIVGTQYYRNIPETTGELGAIEFGITVKLGVSEYDDPQKLMDLKRAVGTYTGMTNDQYYKNGLINISFYLTGKKDGFVFVDENNNGFQLNTNSADMQFLTWCTQRAKEWDKKDDIEINNGDGVNDWRMNPTLASFANIKFDKYDTGTYVINDFSISNSNNFSHQHLQDISGEICQFMGGTDISIEMNISTMDPKCVSAFNQINKITSYYMKKFHHILPCFPFRIDSEFSRFVSVSDVMISNISINTVPEQPGLYNISLSMQSVDRTLRSQEAMKRIEGTNYGVKYSSYGTTADVPLRSIDNYFHMEKIIARAELYPDLELPTLEEMENVGYKFVRYKFQDNRIFVDPDFYFLYLNQLSSQVLREIIIQSNDSGMEGEMDLVDKTGAKVTIAAAKYEGFDVKKQNKISMEQREKIAQAKKAQQKLKSINMKENLKSIRADSDESLKTWDISTDIKVKFMEQSYKKEYDAYISKIKSDIANIKEGGETSSYKDKDGNTVEKKTVVNADGSKTETTTKKDKDGNILETKEEVVKEADKNGENRMIVQKNVNKETVASKEELENPERNEENLALEDEKEINKRLNDWLKNKYNIDPAVAKDLDISTLKIKDKATEGKWVAIELQNARKAAVLIDKYLKETKIEAPAPKTKTWEDYANNTVSAVDLAEQSEAWIFAGAEGYSKADAVNNAANSKEIQNSLKEEKKDPKNNKNNFANAVNLEEQSEAWIFAGAEGYSKADNNDADSDTQNSSEEENRTKISMYYKDKYDILKNRGSSTNEVYFEMKEEIDAAVEDFLKQEKIRKIFSLVPIEVTPKFIEVTKDIIYSAACSATAEKEYANKQNAFNWRPSPTFIGVMPGKIQDNTKKNEAVTVEEGIENAIEFGLFRFKMYNSNEFNTIMKKISYSSLKKWDEDDKKAYPNLTNYFLIDPYYSSQETASIDLIKEYKLGCICNPRYAVYAFMRIMLIWIQFMLDTQQLPSFGADLMRSAESLEMDILNTMAKVGAKTASDSALKKALASFSANAFAIDSGKMFLASIYARTDGDNTLAKRIDNREYEALNSFSQSTAIPTKKINSKDVLSMTVRKMEMALAGLGRLKDFNADGVLQTNPAVIEARNQDEKKFVEAAEDPAQFMMHACHDMIVNDARGRMLRAFPTYYLLFIDEGRDVGVYHLHDNFYNNMSILEIEVVKSRKIAADTAHITLSNLYNSFSTDETDNIVGYNVSTEEAVVTALTPFNNKERAEKAEKIRSSSDTESKLKLRPGARIHLRMGYGSNAAMMPVCFNGTVAECNAAETVEIVAQGDGIELMNPIYEEIEAQKAVQDDHLAGGIGASLFSNGATPAKIMRAIMTNVGGIIASWAKLSGNADWLGTSPYGIYHFGSPDFKFIHQMGEPCQNIYEAQAQQKWNYGKDGSGEFAKDDAPSITFDIFGKTPWDIAHICKSVMPDFIVGVAPFDFRSTLFIGAPRYYYAYSYLNVNGAIHEKRKPYQQYHFYTSSSDIIANGIIATQRDMKTVALGLYQSCASSNSKEQHKVGPLYADIDIYPENQKTMIVDTNLLGKGAPIIGVVTNAITSIEFVDSMFPETGPVVSNEKIAWRMTASALRESMMNMYAGDLVILGDPSIKPHDRMYIFDNYEQVTGQCLAREVVHRMSFDSGFLTTVSPDAIVTVDDPFETIVNSSLSCKLPFGMSSVLGVMTTALAFKYRHLDTEFFKHKMEDFMKRSEKASKVYEKGKEALDKGKEVLDKAKNSKIGKEALDKAKSAKKKAIEKAGYKKAKDKIAKGIGKKVLKYGGKFIAKQGFKTALAAFYPVGTIAAIALTGLEIAGTFINNKIERFTKNLEVVHVYPMKRYGRAWTAGLTGSKGMIHGSPSEKEQGALQSMLGSIIGHNEDDGIITGILKELFWSDEAMENVEKFKRINDIVDSNGNPVSGPGSFDTVLKASASSGSSKNKVKADYRQMLLIPRADYEKGDDVLRSYNYFYIMNPKMYQNDPKINNLRLISDEVRIQPYIEEKFFKIIHETPALNTGNSVDSQIITIKGEQKYVKVIQQKQEPSSANPSGMVYDMPLLHPDAINILYEILRRAKNNMPAANGSDPRETYEETKNSFILLESALRVGDTKSQASTGFGFVLRGVEKAAQPLANAIKSLHDEIKEFAEENSILNSTLFDSKDMGDNKTAIMVRMPKVTGANSNVGTKKSSTNTYNAQENVPYKITKVVDGDTIDIDVNGTTVRVRLIGVNTPESVHKDANKNTEEGKIASEYSKSYLTGKTVTLEFDAESQDKYSRLLAYVYVEGEMFNKKLVEDGMAIPMAIEPNTKYKKEFEKLAEEAKALKKGLWNSNIWE